MSAVSVNLTGVPETMLWTLYNRASEAARPDTFLRDPECVRIFESLAYDFRRNFGRPDDSHPMRSRIFDDALKPWLQAHPGGSVVELAAGLETQFQRCDDGQVRWFCVDVPQAISLRERFLPPSERCRSIPRSALDFEWMEQIPAERGVFVTAQGLFMYFAEAQVRRLFVRLLGQFPGVQVMFDTIPVWFSEKTLSGFRKTKSYVAPPMPWGVRRDDIESLLRSWSDRVAEVTVVSYGFARGMPGLMLRLFASVPGLRNIPPAIVLVRTRGAKSQAR